jgi:hypothetical protein
MWQAQGNLRNRPGRGIVYGRNHIQLGRAEEVLMKRKWIVAIAVAVMLIGGASVASAQFRMDIDVPWFMYVGLSQDLQDDLGVSTGLENIGEYLIIVPNIQAYFTFGPSLFKLGVGARLYTVLLANFIYPSIMGEVRLGDFDVNLNMGGLAGLAVAWGGYWDTVTGPWVTMDLSAGYRLTNWFRVGVGAFAIAHKDFLGEFPYAVYLSGKFIVNPGKKKKVVEE